MYRILNFLCFHLVLSKSIILPDYLTSDSAFEKRLINVWPTLATFNKRWVNVCLQRSFNVLLLALIKFPNITFQERSHNVKTNVETTFLKRFCTGWEGRWKLHDWCYSVVSGKTVHCLFKYCNYWTKNEAFDIFLQFYLSDCYFHFEEELTVKSPSW